MNQKPRTTNLEPRTSNKNDAFAELETGVKYALETYSNVHRGSGHFSLITTELYEKAREIVIEYLGLSRKKYTVIFCSAYGVELLQYRLRCEDYRIVSSKDIYLPLGIRALAVKKKALPSRVPFQTGGSVARMVSPNYIIWAGSPRRFEAGTPMVINAIAFAKALTIVKKYGSECFRPNFDYSDSAEQILFNDNYAEYTGAQIFHDLHNQVFGKYMQVCINGGRAEYVNFDNAASTPAIEPVWNAVKMTWRSSLPVHKEIILNTRELVKSFFGAGGEYEVVFACNTTEAINLTARLIQERYRNVSDAVILNTMLEHNANELPWRYLPGISTTRIGITGGGFFDMSGLETRLREYNHDNIHGNKRIRLVAVSGASNVLGTCNDMEQVCRIAHKYGAEVLVDGAQMVAHRKVELEKWGVDYFAFSGHKVYAPFGSGALVIKKELLFASKSISEKITHNGEENAVGIAALGKAITLLQRIGIGVVEERERELTIRMLNGLAGIEGLKVHGVADPDSPQIRNRGGIVSFYANKGNHRPLANRITEYGAIGLRYGCFCSHMLVKHELGVGPGLERFQNTLFTIVPSLADLTVGLIRVSFGIENDTDEVDRFVALLKRILYNRNDKKSSRRYKQELKSLVDIRLQMVYMK